MRSLILSLFVLCGACETKSTIENLESRDVKKDPFDWKDPGAKPDSPIDAGVSMDGSAPMDAATEDADAN